MFRLLLLLTALLLPLQSAWSAASAYCQHETGASQSQHFGHHSHVHQGEAKQPSDGKWMVDADCAACHAGGAAALPTTLGGTDFAAASMTAEAIVSLPYTSALARAPDRPQWLRLV